MNHQEATDFLVELFPDSTPPGYIELALTAYRVVDGEGRPPVHVDYVDTFDQWLAAARVAELMDINGAMASVADGSGPLLSVESEGSSFKFGTSGDTWLSLSQRLRAMSDFNLEKGDSAVGWICLPESQDELIPRSYDGSLYGSSMGY